MAVHEGRGALSLQDIAERFERVVRFWNRGPVATAEDVHAVIRLFAHDPWASRPVERPPLPEPVVRMELLFFGPPVPGVTTVDSGSILPGEVVCSGDWGYVAACPMTPTTLDIPDAWIGDLGRTLPTETTPEDYRAALEQNRQSIGTVLAELVGGGRVVTDAYVRALYGRCVAPFATYDPNSATGARLWLNGVEACLAEGLRGFLREQGLHSRLGRCGHHGCDQFLFAVPGAAGRPARFCSDKHRFAASQSRRGT